MSFTRKQQGHFRTLVEQAWTKIAKADGLNPKDATAKRGWYETQLEIATGKRTTKECDARRDFEAAMAHFETLVGDSFYWNHRVYGADHRRLIHVIRELCADADVDEEYMRGIARRALSRDLPPDLAELTYDELALILISLKTHFRRQEKRGQSTDRPRRKAEEIEAGVGAVEEPF